MTPQPVISVVIPTYNRVDRLGRVLAALVAQRLTSPFEVIVVSDGSTDGTDRYLESLDLPLDLTWETQRNQGPAVARNRGVELARSPIVLFLDDDVLPDPDLLVSHLRAHSRHEGSTVVIGPMLDPPDHQMTPWVRWEQRMLAKQYAALVSGAFEPTFRQFYTGNASIRRDDVLAVGGFDGRYRRAEDVELGIRLWERGSAFAYEPDARGFHYAERSFEAWRNIARVYGAFEVDFAREPTRDWQWEFLAYSYRSRHVGVRAVVQGAIRAPRVADAAVGRSERWLLRLDRSRAARATQWLLSTIYATDYWRATASAVGGRRALGELVRTGSAPASLGLSRPSSVDATPDSAQSHSTPPEPAPKGTP